MNLYFFIARRIYKEKSGDESFTRPAILIATSGIAVGIIVMIISISVVFGFKDEVSNKVIGFGSHIQILSQTQDENRQILPVNTDSALMNILSKTPHLTYCQEFATKSGLIKTDEDFRGIIIKGVGENYDLSFFRKYLLKGTLPTFSSQKSNDQLLISQSIASEMNLDVGSRVFVYFIDEHSEDIRARKFTVSGIYQTHLEEFDKQTSITDIYTVRRLNNWTYEESSGVELVLDDMCYINSSMDYLISNVNHTTDSKGFVRCAFSIRELSPHIFSWLDVLDINVVMILILMLAIGGFTVMAGLLIVMLDRMHMIGILKAMGASNMMIRKTFSYFAVMVAGRGVIIGDVISIGLCFIQKYFSVIKLNPANYYIDTVPIQIDWGYICAINLGVLFISSLVIFGSSFLMSIKSPSSAIRWE